jgi:hypothetical protein
MKRGFMLKFITKTLALLLLGIGLSANVSHGASPDGPKFEFLGQKLEGDYLTMDYKLPFGGMVEVRVFAPNGDLVWQNQYIHPRGENRIRLKAAAFETGNSYTIQLNYKREEYKLQVERK